jgi:hypothetical protein
LGRQYQVSKREPIILLNPSLERAASEQKYHHASTPSPLDESQLLRKRVEPLPRYVLERSLDIPNVRAIHTPEYTASKQPPPNTFSEPPEPAPVPPKATPDFVTNKQNEEDSRGGGVTHVSDASRHREAFSKPSGVAQDSGLGLAGLGVGGAGQSGVAGLGLGGSSDSGSGSQLKALGGLISG